MSLGETIALGRRTGGVLGSRFDSSKMVPSLGTNYIGTGQGARSLLIRIPLCRRSLLLHLGDVRTYAPTLLWAFHLPSTPGITWSLQMSGLPQIQPSYDLIIGHAL